jgi:hypothetical protein
MELLIWLEGGTVATWVRESLSLWAFPTLIALHALGMAGSVGLSVAICLLILRSVHTFPINRVKTVFKFIWLALGVNFVSGGLLLVANATEVLILPVFYIKLFFVLCSAWILVELNKNLLLPTTAVETRCRSRLRPLALTLLGCWIASVAAGRLTAYPSLFSG